jgi:hypothetical protein
LADDVAPTDIEEGMRVGLERGKMSIKVSFYLFMYFIFFVILDFSYHSLQV